MAKVTTFYHMQGRQATLPASDASWSQHGCRNDNGTSDVYQRVQSGMPLDPTIDHVVVDYSSDDSASKEDMHIGDLVYHTNEAITDQLNRLLRERDAEFGPFFFVSDASLQLLQLQRKKSSKAWTKATELRNYLEEVATSMGFKVEAFEQWGQVMKAKNRRDAASHPLKMRKEDLSFFKSLLAQPSSRITGYTQAVEALVVVAESKGLR